MQNSITKAHEIDVRPARLDERPALAEIMEGAIARLQAEFLSAEQVVASRSVMGLDAQLIEDGTYFVAEIGDRIVGCGGWSKRATLYGGDRSMITRRPELLDPMHDAARIRAMYTHPDFARRGIGRSILRRCEEAAAMAGFTRLEMMSTLSGQKLYEAAGYLIVEHVADVVDGTIVPLIRMAKAIGPAMAGAREV